MKLAIQTVNKQDFWIFLLEKLLFISLFYPLEKKKKLFK